MRFVGVHSHLGGSVVRAQGSDNFEYLDFVHTIVVAAVPVDGNWTYSLHKAMAQPAKQVIAETGRNYSGRSWMAAWYEEVRPGSVRHHLTWTAHTDFAEKSYHIGPYEQVEVPCPSKIDLLQYDYQAEETEIEPFGYSAADAIEIPQSRYQQNFPAVGLDFDQPQFQQSLREGMDL